MTQINTWSEFEIVNTISVKISKKNSIQKKNLTAFPNK